MSSILEYFAEDPLRVLYAVGGSGGLWFWVAAWRNRTRVMIHNIRHEFQDDRAPNVKVALHFELENLGGSPTSLEPVIIVSGVDKERRKWSDSLRINGQDRHLEPHKPQELMALGTVGAGHAFWIYRTYCFSLTRGNTTRARFRTQPGKQPLGFFRFHFERILFQRFGCSPFLQEAA